jgi:ParB family chromosome partitioning protein
MSAKGGLGRGLSALIPNKRSAPLPMQSADLRTPQGGVGTVVEVVPRGERILHVKPADIVPNPHQPRREFHVEELDELVSSVKTYGILQPLVVTEKANGMFELVAGERRLRAAKLAGLAKVPVILRSASEQEKLELALIENIQREDLSPLEEGMAYERLMSDFNLTQEMVAERVGKSRSVVANTLRLLRLPSDIQLALADGRVSMSMARVLVGMEVPSEQRAMFERMLKGDYNVRQAEEASRAAKGPGRVRATSKDVNVMAMEEELRNILATRVMIKKKEGKGKIEIDFYSEEELRDLVDRIKE